jgi:hypothetical protein
MKTMKEEYDFTNAEQVKFYRPLAQLEIPVYLESDVRKSLLATAAKAKRSIGELVNGLLRNDIEIARSLQ